MRTKHPVGLLLAITACSPAGGSMPNAVVSEENGVTIVENHGAMWTGESAWSIGTEPSLVLGVLEGDPDHQLYAVRTATRAADGSLFVLDEARSVRRFSADGRALGTIGGPGSGPGEFADPERLILSPDGSLAIWDADLLRTTLFDAEGELIDTKTLDLVGYGASKPGDKAASSQLYPTGGFPLSGRRTLLRLAAKEDATGTRGVFRRGLGLQVVAEDGAVSAVGSFEDDELSGLAPPFESIGVYPARGKRTQIAIDPGGRTVCVGEQTIGELECHDDVSQRVVRWPIDPDPLTEGDVAEWRASRIEEYSVKMSEADAATLIEGVAHPPFRPAYGALIVSRAGEVWVERFDQSKPTYWVFDPSGILLGEVTTPDIEILEVGPDYVLGVFTDDLEVEYVHVYPLVKPAP